MAPSTCCAGRDDYSRSSNAFLLTVTSVVLVALGGLAGSITDYRSYFPALGGPNGLLYELTLKVAQPWRRNIPHRAHGVRHH